MLTVIGANAGTLLSDGSRRSIVVRSPRWTLPDPRIEHGSERGFPSSASETRGSASETPGSASETTGERE